MQPPLDQFALSSLPLPPTLAISSSGASSQLKQPVPLVEKELSETRNSVFNYTTRESYK